MKIRVLFLCILLLETYSMEVSYLFLVKKDPSVGNNVVSCHFFPNKTLVWNYTIQSPRFYVAATTHSKDEIYANVVDIYYGDNYLFIFSLENGYETHFKISRYVARPVWGLSFVSGGQYASKIAFLSSGMFNQPQNRENRIQVSFKNYIHFYDPKTQRFLDHSISLDNDPSHPLTSLDGGSLGKYFPSEDVFIFWSTFDHTPPNITIVDFSDDSYELKKVDWSTKFPDLQSGNIYFDSMIQIGQRKDDEDTTNIMMMGMRDVYSSELRTQGASVYRVNSTYFYEDIFYWVDPKKNWEGRGTAYCQKDDLVFFGVVDKKSESEKTSYLKFFPREVIDQSKVKDWEIFENMLIVSIECL